MDVKTKAWIVAYVIVPLLGGVLIGFIPVGGTVGLLIKLPIMLAYAFFAAPMLEKHILETFSEETE